MNENVEKMLAELAQANKNLTETITARFSNVDAEARKKETDALVESVLAKMGNAGMRPVEQRRMVWASTGSEAKHEEGVEKLSFSRFLKAVNDKDGAFLSSVKAASGQSETNADGGYAVPVEFANEIIKLERASGLIRTLARVFPMNSATRKVPRGLVDPVVYVVGEGEEPTLSKGTLDQITQTAKKFMSIVPFTDEVLEDNSAGLDTYIAERIALAMGRKEDQIALVGDVSGSSDAFNGVYFASGVNSVSLDGATLSFDDIINLMMAPKTDYRGRGQFVLSTTALKKVMKLKDDENRPIWVMPEAGNPGRILGKPYNESDQIPDTLGTTRANGTNTAILFGAWDSLWISPRGGYTVKSSDSASNSAGKSAFTLDETWFKFRRRQDITVANPEAFAKLAVPA